MADTDLLLVGCGKMGGALLRRAGAQGRVCVIDPVAPPAHFKSADGVTWLSDPGAIDPRFSPAAIILAVKPQHMAAVLPAYARFRASVFLSIAAGQSLAKLGALLGGESYAIVRAMPNLPASIGEGVTVAVANRNVTPAQAALCDTILKALGTSIWIGDESRLDAVTALSGSGPAYVFALAEAMTKAGEALGLPSPLTAQLARQTIAGSGALLAQSPESAAALRLAVTSPGGTTEAALAHLLAPGGLDDLLLKAMQAAARRAGDLAT